MLRTILGS